MTNKRLLFAIVFLAVFLVSCGQRPLQFSPSQLPGARTGQAYQTTITVSDNNTPVGQIYIADGGLPSGLTLSHQRGNDIAEISGIPLVAGKFEFTIGAWCLGTSVNGQEGQKKYTIVVEAALP